jgi:hypothetical protein
VIRIPRFLLQDRIKVRTFAGSGSRGPVFNAPLEGIRASVQSTSRLSRDPRGQDVQVDTLALIRPEDGPIPVQSTIEWNGGVYQVVQSMPVPHARRPTHWELLLVRSSEAPA